jgi:hypothetical protein
LAHACFDRVSAAGWTPASSADVVIVERPALQGDRTRAARPQDLMNLAWSGALLAGAYVGATHAELIEYTPQEWKGSEPKPVQHVRLWRVLTFEERAVLGGAKTWAVIEAARKKGALNRWARPGASYYPRKFTTHNFLDAVALGCYHLGRLERT